MKKLPFTLSLAPEVVARIEQIVAPFQGSVPGYAATIVEDLSALPKWEQDEIREMVKQRALRRMHGPGSLAEADARGNGPSVAIPRQQPSRVSKRRRAKAGQHPETETHQPHQGAPSELNPVPSVEPELTR